MKKSSSFLLIILTFLVLGDCGRIALKPVEPTPTPRKQAINPGDKVGSYFITTADENEVFYVTKTHCPFDNSTKTEFCELTVGTNVNVSLGTYEDNVPGGKSVDDYWSEQTFEMFIEGYPVNLEAFGYTDFTTRREGRVRVWDVVITADAPGTITAQTVGVVGGTPIDYTVVITFVER